MAATWKICPSDYNAAQVRSDTDHTCAALNVSGLKITLRNHADDTATWTCEGDGIDSADRFAYGTDISIWKVEGNTAKRVFRGAVTSIPREGSGEAERVSYEARGGWYWLGKCFYTQEWAVGEGSLSMTEEPLNNAWGTPTMDQIFGTGGTPEGAAAKTRQVKTRVILGGTAQTPTAQIRAILDCAAKAGAPLRTGGVSVSSARVPADEEIDLTCANAIDRLLAWFPDTAVWFDYGVSGDPAVHVVRRSSLGTLSLPVERAAESVRATPRHDLVVPGVEIVYEITSSKNGKPYRDAKTDSAGNATALGAARFTVQLDGGSVDRVWQRIETNRIWEKDLADPDWWAKRIPELKGWTGPDGTGKPVITPVSKFPKVNGATLNKELVSGNIPPWLKGAVSASVPVECTADYALGGESVVGRTIRLTLTLTNASGGVYASTQSRQEGETVPKGLARQIFAAVSHLYYQGTVRYVGEDAPRLFPPGYRLNLSGGLPAWKNMDSAIQSVELDIGAGATTCSFGPPEHLGPQDLVQLAQANRKRAEVRSSSQSSADLSSSSPPLGGLAPNTSSGVAGGAESKREWVDPVSNETTVAIDGAKGTIDFPWYGKEAPLTLPVGGDKATYWGSLVEAPVTLRFKNGVLVGLDYTTVPVLVQNGIVRTFGNGYQGPGAF